MSEHFFQEKTVEKAVEKAERELGISRERLEIEVLEEKDKSLLGMKWGKTCSIRVTAKDDGRDETPATAEFGAADIAKESLKRLLDLTNIKGDIKTCESEDEIVLETRINGDSGSLFIGRRGKNIDAYQYIVNKIVEKKIDGRVKRIIIDSENYRARKIERIEGIAKKGIMAVKKSGRSYALPPMNAEERRIIHMTAKREGFVTESNGNGIEKKVVIFPPDKR